MTDTALHADVVLPATTQLEHVDVVFSWGHHYLTWNEPAIEPLGEAKPNTETFRLLAARLGLDDPAFRETDERADRLDARRLPAVADRTWTSCASAAGSRSTSARASTPHADGGFGTADGPGAAARALRAAGRGGATAELAERFPLALVTPKTHLFLNSTFANQGRQHSAQPEPPVFVHPDDAAARGIADGARVRVYNDRGDFTCAARVSDDARPGVLVAPMGWWNRDYEGGRSGQATTSQRLTEEGHAPDRSTTTAWSWSPPSNPAARSPPWRPGSGRPPRPAARARSGRAVTAASTAVVGRLLILDRARDPEHVGARRGAPPPPPRAPRRRSPRPARRGRP